MIRLRSVSIQSRFLIVRSAEATAARVAKAPARSHRRGRGLRLVAGARSISRTDAPLPSFGGSRTVLAEQETHAQHGTLPILGDLQVRADVGDDREAEAEAAA